MSGLKRIREWLHDPASCYWVKIGESTSSRDIVVNLVRFTTFVISLLLCIVGKVDMTGD